LLNGFADPGLQVSTPETATFHFSNLPPGSYTLIEYTTIEGAGRALADSTVGGTTYFTQAQPGTDFDGTFVRASNRNLAGVPDTGNYVRFDMVSPDDGGNLTLSVTTVPDPIAGFGIAGIQLQQVPEPRSIVLVVVGMLVVLKRLVVRSLAIRVRRPQ